ncbi:Lrp/AsnC family transcriptional regulator [Streptomyces sp. NPDC001185]|uniref:Lrp/AsnC family transcriptional regulator n=1 Tax=Streptomyces sp. NPDC001185 TaxID=3154380 RepID=UPI003329B7B0
MSNGSSSNVIDDLDRRIIAALQLGGRAPWSAIAHWAGASETTVQRRYQALRERHLVRVVATLELDRTASGSSMLVRVQARPGRGLELARILAACPQVRFVPVVTGAADLVVDFVADDNDQLMRLLYTDLPGADLITGTECVAAIRSFTSPAHWDTGLLPAQAREELRPAALAAPYERKGWDESPQALSEVERAVARALSTDGRMPVSALARELGRTESSAARALERLVNRGVLHFRTLVDPRLLGFEAEFMVWLSVEPDRLDAAGRQLARHSGTKLLSAATGRFNLVGHVVLPHRSDLFRYTGEILGALPGLIASEITLHLATLKHAWTRMAAPDRPLLSMVPAAES